MAREQAMIDPFEERQVRDGVISYGLSSYGYDIRVSDEFKIFTNVHTATVDPKNFDPRSFVDWQGPVCMVPPNSFALARSVEYFRIPRNVLTVCLGKSTYARCFSGDTRVALIDGTDSTLEQMAEGSEKGTTFWGYSLGVRGGTIVARFDAPRYIDRDALVEIALDSGARIRCTPDHEFLRPDGRVVAADDLRPADSLWAPARKEALGPEVVFPRRERTVPALASEPAPGLRRRKVESIRELKGDHDVYCLTVPETGNFALAAGVFTLNCGIIVNVTPLEPEWEGHVTLEISNTTPLPAKIYANEGIAQVVFFESDEPCGTSYADRRGKYQAQRGVTLPRL